MKRNTAIIIISLLVICAVGFCTYWFLFRGDEKNDSAGKIVFQYKDEGENILRLQKALNDKGYGLVEDGIWGRNTEKAVMEYFGKNTVTLSDIYKLENS